MALVAASPSCCSRFAHIASNSIFSIPSKSCSSSAIRGALRLVPAALFTHRQRYQAYGHKVDSMTIRSVPVQVAHDLLNAGHHYLDVRTAEEFAAGHVEGAVNIAVMHKGESGMNKNPEFVSEVSSRFDKDDEIVVGCQSGKRSMIAATELTAAGFTGVTDMGGGYAAWVQSDLPVAK